MMRSFSDTSAKPANADCKVHVRSFELVPPAFFRRHGGFSRSDVRFALGTSEGDRRPPVWEKLEWTEFYLSRSGFELVPGVPEVMRVLRHEVQHVPFARVASALLPSGPAAHLYAR